MAFKAKKSKAVESSTPASWSVAQFSSFYTQNRSELIAHAAWQVLYSIPETTVRKKALDLSHIKEIDPLNSQFKND